MTEALQVEKPIVLDILPAKGPALSTTSDMPVVETKPDASNEGKPPEPKAASETEVVVEDKTKTGESATPPENETAANGEPEKKPAKGVQKRLDELTRQREEERAARIAAEKRHDELMKAIMEGRIQPASTDAPAVKTTEATQDEDPEPQRPTKTDFSDPDAWDAALLGYAEQKAAWTARREVAAARKADLDAQQKRAAEEAQRATMAAHEARVAKAKEKHADWAEVAESDVQITMPMAHAILQHEQGADIQYYLGSHPDEAARISKLPVYNQLVEIGVIAAKVAAPAAGASAPAKPISQAPAPIKPTVSGSAAVAKSPEEESMEEYAARRSKELSSDRRPGRR